MKNQLRIGFKRKIKYPKGNCLAILDEIEDKRAQIFDPLKDGFNPLRDMRYRKACDFVDAIDAIFSRGESTLTKDTGLEYIADALQASQVAQAQGEQVSLETLIEEPDRKAPTGHVWAYGKIQRILRSPVLRGMLCDPHKDFQFNPDAPTFARVNRAELGEFDALVIGLLLMVEFKGQLVIPDLGFYGRDLHTQLIREGRLIAGVGYLDELPVKLRRAVLSIEDRVAQGAIYDDAEELAVLKGFERATQGFHDEVAAAMR